MRVAGARADFGFVEPRPPEGDRLYYRAGNLPRLIRQTRERLARLTAEARELGPSIPEGVDA
jgi:hypothetical protein